MKTKKDITGKRFNRWTVIGFDSTKNKQLYWWCKCDCGNIKSVMTGSLTRNLSKSCGCLRVEVSKVSNLTHGAAVGGKFRLEYVAWRHMLNRCRNKRDKNYHRYGGRGITVCDRWLKSFEAFDEDMGPKPNGTSIDRIDNEKGYSPDNCRWATPTQQSNNRRSNHFLELNGERLTIADWSKKTGISQGVLSRRKCLGWSDWKAITTKVKKRKHMVSVNGKSVWIHDLAKETGIKAHVLRTRFAMGWSAKKCISLPVREKVRLK